MGANGRRCAQSALLLVAGCGAGGALPPTDGGADGGNGGDAAHLADATRPEDAEAGLCQLPPPTFSPPDMSTLSTCPPSSISLTDPGLPDGGVILYSTTNSPLSTVYSGPISATAQVSAIAMAPGCVPSDVASASYTFVGDPLAFMVTLSPSVTSQENPFTVSAVVDPDYAEGVACYTLDGGTPACSAFCATTCSSGSQTYDPTMLIPIGPSVTNSAGMVTVKAAACPGEGDGTQYVAAQAYALTISPVTFTASGTCPQTETLAINGTFNATICYSFDGTPVSTGCTGVAGHVYCFSSGPHGTQTNTGAGQPAIVVTSSTTVQTQTCLAGFQGAAASQTFTVSPPCP
jgi:hypothetical protein